MRDQKPLAVTSCDQSVHRQLSIAWESVNLSTWYTRENDFLGTICKYIGARIMRYRNQSKVSSFDCSVILGKLFAVPLLPNTVQKM